MFKQVFQSRRRYQQRISYKKRENRVSIDKTIRTIRNPQIWPWKKNYFKEKKIENVKKASRVWSNHQNQGYQFKSDQFNEIISEITKEETLDENCKQKTLEEKIVLFGSLHRPERVYWEQFISNKNKADKIEPTITLTPNKYYVRQIIQRNLKLWNLY